MSINRHAKRRDDNEREIVQALREIGAQVWQIDTPTDLLVDFRRRWYLVEVKQSKRKNHKDQFTEIQQDLMAQAEAPVLVVYDPEDAISKIGSCYK